MTIDIKGTRLVARKKKKKTRYRNREKEHAEAEHREILLRAQTEISNSVETDGSSNDRQSTNSLSDLVFSVDMEM